MCEALYQRLWENTELKGKPHTPTEMAYGRGGALGFPVSETRPAVSALSGCHHLCFCCCCFESRPTEVGVAQTSPGFTA